MLGRLKRAMDRALQRLGYRVIRSVDAAPMHPPDILSPLLDWVFRDRAEVQLIQIGANDGVRYDPIRPFILANAGRVRALLVEPLPDFFKSLVSNYAGIPKLTFERCALAKEGGEARLYRVRPDAEVEDWKHGMASFDRRHVLMAVDEAYVEAVLVPAMTAEELTKKHGLVSCDVLQIDTEGYDYEVLRMFLDTGLRPRVIHYENLNLSRQDHEDSKKLLYSLGYKYFDVGWDTLALDPEVTPEATPHGETAS